MPNIGPLELAIVAIIALIVLGPKRLPDAGRSLGHGMREFKNAITGGGKDEHEAQPVLATVPDSPSTNTVPPTTPPAAPTAPPAA